MSRDLSTYSPEFQAFVRSICAEFSQDTQRCSHDLTASIGHSPDVSTVSGRRIASRTEALASPLAAEKTNGNRVGSPRTAPMREEIGQTRARRGASVESGSIRIPQPLIFSAAEREGSDGCKDGLADDGQARLSCTGKRTASHGSDAGIDRAGKGVALAAALHPASAKCQQSDAVVSGGSQNRASEYPISPADSSQIQVFPQGHLAESGAGPDDDGLIPTLKSSVTGTAPESFSSELFTALVSAGGVL